MCWLTWLVMHAAELSSKILTSSFCRFGLPLTLCGLAFLDIQLLILQDFPSLWPPGAFLCTSFAHLAMQPKVSIYLFFLYILLLQKGCNAASCNSSFVTSLDISFLRLYSLFDSYLIVFEAFIYLPTSTFRWGERFESACMLC